MTKNQYKGGYARISTFIIVMILMSLFMVSFMVFLSQGSTVYNVTYTNNTMEIFNRFDELNNQTQQIQSSASAIKTTTGVSDIVGDLFSNGFQVLLLSLKSFNTFSLLADQGIDAFNLGIIGTNIKTAVFLIVLIIFFIGILVRTAIRGEI